jgi:peptidoglycan L-alanyl-D-glutamate endopeptidase CwlK
MTFALSAKSLLRLEDVHPDLVRVVKRAIKTSPTDFVVTEGLRTVERQKQLVAAGASKTMKSRHITGHAVDIAPYVNGSVHWDWPLFYPLAKAIKAAAVAEGVPIEWGGDWRTFKDGPHWQLPWAKYP